MKKTKTIGTKSMVAAFAATPSFVYCTINYAPIKSKHKYYCDHCKQYFNRRYEKPCKK